MSAPCPNCADCDKRVAALWTLAADEELPYDELPPEWEQRCEHHILIDRVAEAICTAEGDWPWPSLFNAQGAGGHRRDAYRRMAVAALAASGAWPGHEWQLTGEPQ